MRRLIYYVACTVDGFIARKDGSLDCFLTKGEHFADLLESFPETIPAHLRDMLGVRSENKHFDVVLMGRKTYEVGLEAGITNPYPHLKQYLFSGGMSESPDSEVQLVSGDAVALVKELKREAGKDIWLCGGGELAAQLFPEIDELILKVNPVVIGSGIPLFRGAVKPTALEVVVSKGYDNGFRLTHYRLKHKRNRRDEPKSKEVTDLQCSFCDKKQFDVAKLIAGPGVYICNECVGSCTDALAAGESSGSITTIIDETAEERCSFCGKKPIEVVRIVGVPAARICNECIKICQEILAADA